MYPVLVDLLVLCLTVRRRMFPVVGTMNRPSSTTVVGTPLKQPINGTSLEA